jgi:hypothetical protein
MKEAPAEHEWKDGICIWCGKEAPFAHTAVPIFDESRDCYKCAVCDASLVEMDGGVQVHREQYMKLFHAKVSGLHAL